VSQGLLLVWNLPNRDHRVAYPWSIAPNSSSATLMGRPVGGTVRAAVNISGCLFRRIGRAKYLETLNCGTLEESGPIFRCDLEENTANATAGLNTIKAFH